MRRHTPIDNGIDGYLEIRIHQQFTKTPRPNKYPLHNQLNENIIQ